MPYGVKIKAEMSDCAFLWGKDGICPYHTKICNKPCDKYARIGDSSKEIFHDWNNGLEDLVIKLRMKYFGTDKKDKDLQKDIKDLLGD